MQVSSDNELEEVDLEDPVIFYNTGLSARLCELWENCRCTQSQKADLAESTIIEYKSCRSEWIGRCWEWIQKQHLCLAITGIFGCIVGVPCFIVTTCSLLYGLSLTAGVIISEIFYSQTSFPRGDGQESGPSEQFILTPLMGSVGLFAIFALCTGCVVVGIINVERKPDVGEAG